MTAEESLREGALQECLEQLQSEIRSNPADVRARVFLFQLLAVNGTWDRALTQLNVLGDLDAGTLAMVHTYRSALQCELLREEVFTGKRAPLVFGDPEDWVAQLIQAVKLVADGAYEAAQALRDRAFEAAPASAGQVDGHDFAWIADQDTRLGPMLEAIVNGAYYWVPFDRLARVQIEAPADLRDVVWMPANFTWSNGGEIVGFIPTRYPGSERSEDAQIRLARRTEWIDRGHDVFLGLGQRTLGTDQDDYALMDIRDITFAAANGQGGPSDG